MPTPTCRAPAITLAAATRWLRGLLTAWIRADLYVALAVTALGGYAAGALGVAQDLGASGALFFGTLLIYSLDHGRDAREAETRSGWRSGAGRSDGRRAVTGRLPFAALAGVGLTAAFALGGPRLLAASILPGVVGLLYGLRLPGGLRLKDLPGSKAALVAGAVSWACIALPLAAQERWPGSDEVPLALLLLAITWIDATAFDVRDHQREASSEPPTLVDRLGRRRTLRLLIGVATLGACVALACPTAPPGSVSALGIVAVSVPLLGRRPSPIQLAALADGWLFLPALARALGLP